jgi:drug/metabolite transporter (DMT)-like permease
MGPGRAGGDGPPADRLEDRRPARADRWWPAATAFAVAEIVVPFPLIASGEQRVSSSIAAMLVATVTIALCVSTMLLAPLAIVSAPHAVASAVASVSDVVLEFVCSAGAVVVFFLLIAEVGPGRSTVITYINPVAALLALGWRSSETG